MPNYNDYGDDMEDRNSPEVVKARSEQEDPIIMYLIVRESLDMGRGKTGAQCGHAAQMLQLAFNETEKEQMCGWEVKYNLNIFQKWLDASFRKVVLKADDKEWAKLKEEFKDSMVLVIDAGLTEIPSGSETVIGLWPMYKSQAPKILKKLQVLK